MRRQLDNEGNELLEPRGERRFLEARAGNHLMMPFQCELCHFRNVRLCDPGSQSAIDREFLEYIRRALLDAFWARETSTVKNNLANAKMLMKFIDRLSLPVMLPPMGPFPLDDTGWVCPWRVQYWITLSSQDAMAHVCPVRHGEKNQINDD
jgi:hypothetical protein